jgi:hypothetical protein
MARTQERGLGGAKSSSEDTARRSSFGRLNKRLFFYGPVGAAAQIDATIALTPMPHSRDTRRGRSPAGTWLASRMSTWSALIPCTPLLNA